MSLARVNSKPLLEAKQDLARPVTPPISDELISSKNDQLDSLIKRLKERYKSKDLVPNYIERETKNEAKRLDDVSLRLKSIKVEYANVANAKKAYDEAKAISEKLKLNIRETLELNNIAVKELKSIFSRVVLAAAQNTFEGCKKKAEYLYFAEEFKDLVGLSYQDQSIANPEKLEELFAKSNSAQASFDPKKVKICLKDFASIKKLLLAVDAFMKAGTGKFYNSSGLKSLLAAYSAEVSLTVKQKVQDEFLKTRDSSNYLVQQDMRAAVNFEQMNASVGAALEAEDNALKRMLSVLSAAESSFNKVLQEVECAEAAYVARINNVEQEARAELDEKKRQALQEVTVARQACDQFHNAYRQLLAAPEDEKSIIACSGALTALESEFQRAIPYIADTINLDKRFLIGEGSYRARYLAEIVQLANDRKKCFTDLITTLNQGAAIQINQLTFINDLKAKISVERIKAKNGRVSPQGLQSKPITPPMPSLSQVAPVSASQQLSRREREAEQVRNIIEEQRLPKLKKIFEYCEILFTSKYYLENFWNKQLNYGGGVNINVDGFQGKVPRGVADMIVLYQQAKENQKNISLGVKNELSDDSKAAILNSWIEIARKRTIKGKEQRNFCLFSVTVRNMDTTQKMYEILANTASEILDGRCDVEVLIKGRDAKNHMPKTVGFDAILSTTKLQGLSDYQKALPAQQVQAGNH